MSRAVESAARIESREGRKKSLVTSKGPARRQRQSACVLRSREVTSRVVCHDLAVLDA
jgi:hypothetical protein